MKPILDVAIVGAGLSGLMLADLLLSKNRNIEIYEARNRIGGRILTQSNPHAEQALDLGPTWIWPEQQPYVAKLVERLGLKLFRQWDGGHSLYQIDAHQGPSLYIDVETHMSARRIEGGCAQLVSGLSRSIPNSLIKLQHRLTRLTDCGSHIELEFATTNGIISIRARRAVLAVPPRLLANQIEFRPALSDKLIQIMQATPTWMAAHAKAVLIYERPFWRDIGLSGNALLRYPSAVLSEVYDACATNADSAALFGFFGLSAAMREYYRDQLEDLIIEQMTILYGEAAANPLQILIQDWSQEPFTSSADDQVAPTNHPAYGHPAFQLDHWQDKLHFCGSETAEHEGGYLEGALVAAERTFSTITLSENLIS